ncbi:Ldh family oxidoreductase [Breznakiella homolactica]|uniref:Ldh family oxidoreductase n=1 Tax=Breznakiella homolactica TaxID=2798577 RepID=A0A7T7XLW9_9SPIR|nr:Ldh family oxidoreductase [Breznakiella homolactica]QQO08617.1 Ldh family oxidoreductase [Breznakiella homolactica]
MSTVDHLIGKKVNPDALEAWCKKAMVKSGLTESDAAMAADVFTAADTRGIFSHGTRQIRGLMRNVRDGRIDPKAAPSVAVDIVSAAVIDGHDAFPTTNAIEAMKLAIEKAKKTGIAYVGVKNSSHIGALSYYPLMAAKEGLIGIAMTNTDPWMTVPGGKGPIMGTNPIAYAIPNGTEEPIFLDIATSSVAVTKILSMKAVGKKLPDKWLVDENGIPTDDPVNYPEKGALLPMAMHKGYGLALLVETLSAVMTGSAFLSGINCWLNDIPEKANEGHAFIALNIDALMPESEFTKRLKEMTDEIQNSPKADNADKIMLPGDIEHEKRRKAFAQGLELPDFVLVNLYGLAEDISDTEAFNSLFS